jgi:hypothetical protein
MAIIDLDAEVSDGAFDLAVSEQKLPQLLTMTSMRRVTESIENHVGF